MSEKNSRRNVESKKATVSRNGTVVIALPLKSLTPLDVYRLTRDANKPSALFEKYDRACASPQHSIVALEPEKVIYVQNGVATIEECAGASLTCRPITCPFSFLSEILEQIAPVDEPLSELDMAFSSGLVGYLGYGLTSLVEKIDRQEINPFMVPDLGMILPSTIVYFDHVQGKTVIVSRNGSQHAEALRDALVAADRRQPVIAEPDSPKESLPSFELRPGFESAISKDAFLDRVRQTREYIEEGQAFQIVVSQRFYAPITIDAIDIYEELIGSTPSTYNYLLDFNSFQYLGASPETMMNCQNRKVRICALAGTRPRGTTYDEDISNEVELRQNEKEMAEHMMLVDLGRNDLGRICTPGSIELGTIAQVLRYSNVMHLGTEISGTLESHFSVLDAARSCFPRGTVSGAPKVRAMQLLAGLEPEQRGIYAGSVGYIDARGNADLAIAIRSALIKEGVAHVNAGAGIVYDSNPEAEYLETLHKSSAVTSAIYRAQQKGERNDFARN